MVNEAQANTEDRMSTINDEEVRVFGKATYDQDAFLRSRGYTDGPLMDRWKAFLTAEGFPYGTFNDSYFSWLKAQV